MKSLSRLSISTMASARQGLREAGHLSHQPASAIADALADGIAAAPGRSPVNRRAAAAGVLGNMRQRSSVQRRHPFGMPVRQRQAGVDQQAVAVLRRPV
jgi:hypothetical protein